MKRFTITASAGLVAIAFAIAGCGGSAASATTAPAAVSGSTQSAAPAASVAGGTGSSNVPDRSQGPGVVDTASPGATLTAAGASSGPLDPCALLTKADVQPFFSVPVVTELPGPVPGTCEWAANDGPGGVSTSLDVVVITGQDALDAWTVASGPGPKTMFGDVGDQAEHYPNDPDFVSNKGDVTCNITTVGSAHLAGKMDYPVAAIPDAAATQIAQAYGTLCNKIYGSGPTTPTLTVRSIELLPGSRQVGCLSR